jgi:glycosyltransferase involved in cell wall biosynthesis
MKIVQINSVCGSGSTGRIAQNISEKLNSLSIENYIFYGVGYSDYKNAIKFGGRLNVMIHQLGTRLFGKHGFYSKIATYQLVKKLKKINPDIIHLHNIHGHYLNIKILFKYLKKINIKIYWTLHDCWAFTGHCAYYDFVKCDKWKTECNTCPALKDYPKSLFFDRSRESFNEKKELFTSIKDITFITPSKWLADDLKLSFLKNYPVKVINNGIDLNLFKPTLMNVKDEFEIANKFLILGVASVWDRRKGLEYFIELSNMISDKEAIILVGLTDDQVANLPNNIIGMKKTNSIKDLAMLYSSSDVFVNPTLEDNFPTTNLEALACGTPVITFNTGGSPESVDQKTGIVVTKGDLNALYKAIEIVRIKSKEFYTDECLLRAKLNYDKNLKFDEYTKMYLADEQNS